MNENRRKQRPQNGSSVIAISKAFDVAWLRESASGWTCRGEHDVGRCHESGLLMIRMIQAPFSLSPEHYPTLEELTTYAPQSGACLRLARQQKLQAGSLRYLWGAATRAFFS